MPTVIHPTAIVSEGAVIGEDSQIGPYCIVGPRVRMGPRSVLHSHVVLEGHTVLGSGNELFQFSSIGARPQDLKFQGEDSVLEIGDNNIIREYVTLQPGTTGGGMRTVIGNGNLFMANCHVGHDSFLGDGNILANSVAIAGHVTIGNNVILGGLAAVHQFVRIGDLAFGGGGSMITQDLPPFCMTQGDRAKIVGLNRVGMQRKGFSTADIQAVKVCFRELFLGDGTFRSRLEKLRQETHPDCVKKFLDFISAAKRGVMALRSDENESGEG